MGVSLLLKIGLFQSLQNQKYWNLPV